MIQLRINGDTPQQIYEAMLAHHPEIPEIEGVVTKRVLPSKRAVYPYQAAVIYHLAYQYTAGRALEIGTAFGYSGTYIGYAMPMAHKFVTLNPKMKEYHHAVRALIPIQAASVVAMYSWDYLKIYDGPNFDFIFVDGDHENVERDLPWFNRLNKNGLMLFHDYSPEGSGRPTPPVYHTVNQFSERLGRPPDVLVIDSRNVGMAGFYRMEGETWQA
jgi:predicted O-methyltransferase YrrM